MSRVKVNIQHKEAQKILTVTGGYLQGYTHTLNPYIGCTFSCSYCYVRQMPVALFRNQEWGTWLDIKENASEKLGKELHRAKEKGKVTIFMSSSTDPYQPMEYRARITRALLEVLSVNPPDFLMIQTRSPLVTRDIDLLQKLGEHVRVSMTIETDLESIRKAFSPQAPPIQARMRALEQLKEEGIATQAAISPVLPSTKALAAQLSDKVDRVCIDDFFMGDGQKGKRTEKLKVDQLYKQLGLEEWYHPEAYKRVLATFQEYFHAQQLLISQEGFLP